MMSCRPFRSTHFVFSYWFKLLRKSTCRNGIEINPTVCDIIANDYWTPSVRREHLKNAWSQTIANRTLAENCDQIVVVPGPLDRINDNGARSEFFEHDASLFLFFEL